MARCEIASPAITVAALLNNQIAKISLTTKRIRGLRNNAAGTFLMPLVGITMAVLGGRMVPVNVALLDPAEALLSGITELCDGVLLDEGIPLGITFGTTIPAGSRAG